MENLTYEIYLANPAVREQIEREAHRARAEAMHQYIVMPLVKMFSRMFRRARPTTTQVFAQRPELRSA